MADHRDMSPDSSTHISEKSKKSKKRKHRQKSKTSHKKHKSSTSEGNHTHKKSKKHKKRTSKSPSDESEEEILDIKPLSGYVDDRKQLHNEIFTLVSKKEVKDMLPESLKKLKFKEFKHHCLEQLEIMSQKRLRHIIAGQEMVSSSSDESTGPQAAAAQQNKEAGKNTEESVANIITENKPEVGEPPKPIEEPQPTKINILEEMSVEPNQDEIDELVEPDVSQNPLEEPEKDDEQPSTSTSTVTIPDPSAMVPEAELKELEFRARALKSLVMARERRQLERKKAQTHVTSEQNST